MADLFEAIGAGDIGTVRDMLQADPRLARARNGEGVSAVLWACYVQQRELAEVIADFAGEDLDMFEAAALNRPDRLGELIAGDRALVNFRSADGFPAIALAAFFGAESTVRLLLDAGADPDVPATNAMRVTAIHAAAAAHRPDIVRLLLDAGADSNARQHGGWAALHEAAENGDAEMAEALLQAGADPAAKADDGTTPADKAIQGGHVGLAERLRKQA